MRYRDIVRERVIREGEERERERVRRESVRILDSIIFML